MKKPTYKEIIFGATIIIALAIIGIGLVLAWYSFSDFDKTVINEKDTQVEQLIRAEDSNLQISLDSFARESDSFFTRRSVIIENDIWADGGNSDRLKAMLNDLAIKDNSLYAGIVVRRDRKVVRELSTETSLELVAEPNKQNYVICKHDARYFLAYRKIMSKSVEYYVLIDLSCLISDISGEERSSEDMTFMLDESGSIMMYEYGEQIDVIPAGESVDETIDICQNFIAECQSNGISNAQSIEIEDDSKSYMARMLVKCSSDTSNKIFALGKATNYDATILPSRAAASKILLYGGIAAAGVVLLVIALILLRRISSSEIELLQKRNKTLGEINRQMQELTHHQRLETIGTMTASIAHDFNNLLTPIMGYSMMSLEMLPEDATDLQENLMEVYNASLKAKDIVSQFAGLAKNGDASTFEALNPDELILNALKVTLPVKPESVEVKVALNCNSDSIYGDQTQLSQLVINLTLNAYDAMIEHGGKFLVSTCLEDNQVVMRFKDDGIGMNAETVAKMFDPFFTTKGSGKGVGLGLAIVAHVAEMHDAKVYVESQKGIGTEFIIIFNRINKEETV